MESVSLKYHFVDGPTVELSGDGINGRVYTVRFYNLSENRLEQEIQVRGASIACVPRRYFQDWRIVVYDNQDLVLDYTLSLSGMKVLVVLSSPGLGDTLAWIPYVEEFRKRHGCSVVCVTKFNELLAASYPEIEFSAKEEHESVFALYRVGCFNPPDTTRLPASWNKLPLQHVARLSLGLDSLPEIRPSLAPGGKYSGGQLSNVVCVATESTARQKHWNFPDGWKLLAAWLKSRGYTVLNLSPGAPEVEGIDRTVDSNDLALSVHCLRNCAFFIGLSSGLSWLAWAAGARVVMISGATEPWHEFSDKVYVGPPSGACSGCYHRHVVNRHVYEWCPDKRDLECTTKITPEMVMSAIENHVLCSARK